MADEKETLQEVKEKLVRIEVLLESLKDVNELKLVTVEEKIKVVNNRVKDLEDNSKWLWRAVVGAIISAITALLFKR
ncbi:hemolysin XhlA family protein [Desnuesiella massiliensis]|uniref:hemolysin XhlA family protein n=1 Tax=Desnuesiella massiliensis TaxID=1650662 RepID=UPI0006E3F2C5|nr:hemolysin XhlA family protein [Desnuesiella massiliensis]